MSKTYKTFTMARFQLKKYGIEMDDMDQFVKVCCWHIKGKL